MRKNTMRKLAAILALSAAIMSPSWAYAAEPCGTQTWNYQPGKTEEGFKASATDGCHTYQWTSNTTDSSASGTVSFMVTKRVNPWDGDLPNTGDMCQMRAAHEANLMFLNGFKVPAGTEVTVQYRCY
jgi:hypothetical protein